MPCDSILLNKIELGAANTVLLVQGMQSLGFTVQSYGPTGLIFWRESEPGVKMYVRDGKVEVPAGRESLADDIKRAYSKEVLKVASKKFGFALVPGKENKFTLSRRGF